MSGGSWDYFCYKMEEVSDRLINERNPIRRAFGRKMQLFAAAMHDIEWVDSGDYGRDEDEISIKAALGDDANAFILYEVLKEARRIKDELIKYGA